VNFVYISDFFSTEVNGGAEQNDAELLNLLEARGHTVIRVKSDVVNKEFIDEHTDDKFIISNFVFMFNSVKDYIQNNVEYVLYTHDHQYLKIRNPYPYKDNHFIAPKEDLKHVEFYSNAKGVICQSELHAGIVNGNLNLDSIYNVAGNLWTEETLDLLEELSETAKEARASVMMSNIDHKNTKGAIEYCHKTNTSFELLPPRPHEEFLTIMAKSDTLVFLPQTVETLSRIICEARMMNCKVITNANIGAQSEDWFQLKGKELIDVMRQKREDIPLLIEEIFGE